MAVTFSLPTVLARLADGHSTIEADGTTLGDVVAQIADRFPALALADSGRFTPDDEVVLCITGNGLKTVEALGGVLPEAPTIAPRLREVEALHARDL